MLFLNEKQRGVVDILEFVCLCLALELPKKTFAGFDVYVCFWGSAEALPHLYFY